MSLVGYEADSSSSGDDNEEDTSQPNLSSETFTENTTTNNPHDHQIQKSIDEKTYSNEPKPKHRSSDPVKIMIPAAPSNNTDLYDEDDEQPKRCTSGNGLLLRLPKARTELKRRNQKPLIPDKVMRKSSKPSSSGGAVSMTIPGSSKYNPYLAHLDPVSNTDTTTTTTTTMQYHNNVPHSNETPSQYSTPVEDTGGAPSVPQCPDGYTGFYPEQVQEQSSATLPGVHDFEADEGFLRLQGKKRHKKNKQEKIDIIDIREVDVQKESENLRLRSDPDTVNYRSKKGMGNLPSGQQRKKHQITYLAFQAKEMEQQLKSQWAENRATRRAAQSRYGF